MRFWRNFAKQSIAPCRIPPCKALHTAHEMVQTQHQPRAATWSDAHESAQLGKPMLAIADFLALSVPPPLMVTFVFLVAYLLVGLPLHFLRGAESRDALGTLAGLFAGLMYITFIVGVYPDLDGAKSVAGIVSHAHSAR